MSEPQPRRRRGRPRSAPRTAPTASELLVLRGLAAGLRPDQVAARLKVTRSCVSMRIQRATRALGARTTFQAMYVAAERGLFEGVPRP